MLEVLIEGWVDDFVELCIEGFGVGCSDVEGDVEGLVEGCGDVTQIVPPRHQFVDSLAL